MVCSMERWVGKVAIVTGASSGIGAAISESLVIAGLKVVGLARRQERIDELAKKLEGKAGKLYSFRCDMTIESNILDAFEWTKKNVGPVSILVNNAAVYKQSTLTSTPTQDFIDVWSTNVLGLQIATREACKIMMENKIDGHIVHISSVAAHKVIFPGSGLYASTKFAIKALTEGLRLDFNTFGSKCKITSISPGAVNTEIIQNIPDELKETIPLMQPEDIADAVIYALSTPPHVQIHDLIIKPIGEAW